MQNTRITRTKKTLVAGTSCFIAATFFLLPCSHAATAQLRGVVQDAVTSKPLAHVQVFIASPRRGDVSDSRGTFSIRDLSPGTYTLTFQLQGYETKRLTARIVSLGQTLRLHVQLQPTIIELANLVVTATRETNRSFDIPYFVSSMSARAIDEQNAQQTPELLREQMGVTVQKTNQGGGSPIVQGLRANKLLLLIDGIRLNNATYRGGNTQYLNTVNSDGLESVEIVHGPQSVLYGSDALGGVINLLLQQPVFSTDGKHTYHGTVRAALSSADDNRMSYFSLNSARRLWSLQIEGALKSFGDITRGSKGGTELMHRLANDSRTARILPKTQAPNGYTAAGFGLRAHVKLKPRQMLTVAYQLNRQQGAPRYDVIEVMKDSLRLFDPQERDLAYLRYENSSPTRFFDRATATLSLHRQFERRLRIKSGSSAKKMDQFRTLTTGVQVQFNKIIRSRHHLVYGAELYYDDVATASRVTDTRTGVRRHSSPIFPDGSTSRHLGVYAQDRWSLFSDWQAIAGVRYNATTLRAPFEHDPATGLNFGTIEVNTQALTSSLALLIPLRDDVRFMAGVAQGFRAPNLDDISKLGPGKGSSIYDVPNPDANPEESLNLHAGIKVQSSRLRLELLGYYNRLRDLLIRQPAAFNGSPFFIDGGDTLRVFHKANAGKAYTAGAGADAVFTLSPTWQLRGNISYTYGQNLSADEPLSGIPPLSAFAGLRHSTKALWTELLVRWARQQSRLSPEDRQDLRIPEGGTPGWWTLGFRAGWRVTDLLRLRFSVMNVLDRNYREHLSGFNAPGRNIILSAELRY